MTFTKEEQENLRIIQDIELKMLDEINRICEKYNLNYSVAGGTLLGAVRHSDFIPWDDDIDIDLKREDFYKLIEVLPTELSSEYEFVNFTDFNGYFCDFIPRVFYNNCKVKNSFMSDDGTKNLANDDRINGVFIELYCLHETKSSTVKKQILKTKIIYGLAMGHRYFNFDGKKYSLAEKIAVSVLSSIGKIIPLKKIIKIYEKNCNTVKTNNGNCYFKPSVPLPVQENNVFKKHLFDGYEMHKMRNTFVSVPKNYEEILISLYGDWKSLPPEKDRKPSHFSLNNIELY